ncbi:MAG: pyrroline-5-carboxylate reductase [Lachnospiraceae bacterium]|nr:pyrroline-5-carboxylate reductase [Lachnospiraceae bacterium]MDE6981163.1 pyrroline-5-carboxylate reductase [Lachnospiraceae bacterium]
MKKSITFIGGGNMASAIIGGILQADFTAREDITATAKTEQTCEKLKKEFNIKTTTDNAEGAKDADILFLAVKPFLFKSVIPQIRDMVKPEALIVSIAAGQTMDAIETLFDKDIKLIRVMPNTPALVGESMSALCKNSHVSSEEMEEIVSIFESFGKAEIVPESLMDTVTGISGSSPAYVYILIEAMADAAVADGMTRSQAYKFAAQAVLGSAKMVLETGKHPGELKDAVCSPGGTTIAAVAKLEEKGFRDAIISAQRSCVAKSRDMK